MMRSGKDVTINMYAAETKVHIAPGVTFPAWTFDGTVPGQVIYLREGDYVNLTLHCLDPRMAHSIDLHAALVPPNQDFTEVLPGHSKTIHFVARIHSGHVALACGIRGHSQMGMWDKLVVAPKARKAGVVIPNRS